MMAIHTVAAGGGSICAFDGARFRVGPESAGANPGPACYRRGGPLTVTDCNVMLGKIQPALFPHVFGPRGDEPLDARRRRRALRRARRRDRSARPAARDRPRRSPTASSTSPSATWPTRSSTSRSRAATTSPSTRCTASAAPAASTPACVADALGMTRVFIHPLAGVLSAYGMGLADVTRAAPGGGRAAAGRGARRRRGAARALGRRRARRARRARRRARRDRRPAPRPPALRGHRHGARRRPFARRGRAAARRSRRRTASTSAS